MKVLVLVKQVPDTEANIKPQGSGISEGGIKWIISPYDEFAIEEGLKIREKNGGEVIAVSVGPDRVVEALRTSYAMGVDKAVHIKTDDYQTLDSYYTSTLLAEFAKSENPDVIIGGRQSIDSDSSQVVIQIAEYLGIPHMALTLKLDIDGSNARATREVEGGTAEVEAALPVAVTAQKGLNEPRYPSLKGIMTAKKKPVDVKTPADLGAPAGSIEVVSIESPPPRAEGRILEGSDPAQLAAQLVKALREEAKVI